MKTTHYHIQARNADGSPFEVIVTDQYAVETTYLVIARCQGRATHQRPCSEPIDACRDVLQTWKQEAREEGD